MINTVDPGLCYSELGRELGLAITIQKFLLARSAEDGSRDFIIAVSLGSKGNGKYISYGRIARSVIPSPSVPCTCSTNDDGQRVTVRQQ